MLQYYCNTLLNRQTNSMHDLQNVLDDIRKMKIIVKGHERRIKTLEERLATYEQ